MKFYTILSHFLRIIARFVGLSILLSPHPRLETLSCLFSPPVGRAIFCASSAGGKKTVKGIREAERANGRDQGRAGALSCRK